ncbi:uroporphyrinogen decarboxylase [Acidithiobacillus sp. CV18-2]|uniref:Uroporphyrinogen decarboxylase n=1 Tax=Igneacidithiobacillus copahuensis TaxID=2724909 RepID=A0AAE2YQL7_9PROT|nr:uroporphyrinogen decarboxylase [Igneacidithiobacillus copahuensis]MBU2753545.1 uroporphyrinogen decarboxylase [Acidithiobacillus sp. CV18-3]MBU2757382.1 uroporphyrinogen decarboxylase [Acidithiobacillus sp. BN09-2]MBU2776039.1 uroporphyrinogen decarboxylase [Acidithiobacillus sp. CV18-2]MBU2795930.1 uroporphyrinogen decarboxylase [Acidithiobacillus sp. VAN18-2]MBU2800284.1 uroporphyrinogen decarboxylase [Acidithiobacillus sp. VAN18-4]UTV79814.1 uroporphyrinogen decarboxylase [Acidithiobaci
MSKTDRFLRACWGQEVDRTPVWLMRQAGRYLPEYRATRAKVSGFLELCQTPELACEVTLQPLRRFDLDAAILFSDILTVPHAMGMELDFLEGEGPVFRDPLREASDLRRLGQPDPEQDLRYVMDAVRLIRRELDGRVPLIGFAGSPWTLACYMIEGRGSRDFLHAKTWMYSDPESLEALLERLVLALTDYLHAQAAAGAQALMLFDTWGGTLTTSAYERFSLAPLQRVIAGLRATAEAKELPIILFSKGGGNWLERMAASGANVIGLDWTIDINVARTRLGKKIAVQGNLDPIALYGQAALLRAEIENILCANAGRPGHIFNLGHGITPQTPIDNVELLVETVHAWNGCSNDSVYEEY